MTRRWQWDDEEVEAMLSEGTSDLAQEMAVLLERRAAQLAKSLDLEFHVGYRIALEQIMRYLDTESGFAMLVRGDPAYQVEVRFHVPRYIRQ